MVSTDKGEGASAAWQEHNSGGANNGNDDSLIIIDTDDEAVDNEHGGHNDDEMTILRTVDAPRDVVVVDLDVEPEYDDGNNINNNSNNTNTNTDQDDLTILQERVRPSFLLRLPGREDMRINLNENETPTDTSFQNNVSSRRHLFVPETNDNTDNNNAHNNNHHTIIRRDQRRISERLPQRISRGIRRRGGNYNDRITRNRASQGYYALMQVMDQMNRVGRDYPYPFNTPYNDYDDHYYYSDEDDEDDSHLYRPRSNNMNNNNSNLFEEETSTQHIINIIQQREERERDAKVKSLMTRTKPMEEKIIEMANSLPHNYSTFFDPTPMIKTNIRDKNNKNKNGDKIVNAIDDQLSKDFQDVPACVLCGVELGIGIPDDYETINDDDKSVPFDSLVTKYKFKCPYQSLRKPSQLDRDLSKRTFVSKCGHVFCGRCFARIDNAKGKTKLPKKKLKELIGSANPNIYGPRICPADDCDAIIRAKGKLKEVYF